MLVRSLGVPFGLGAVVMRRCRVLLRFVVSAIFVMMRGLSMMMRSGLMVARCGVMMFDSRMSCGRGHLHSPGF
jgi:hypothetical protein